MIVCKLIVYFNKITSFFFFLWQSSSTVLLLEYLIDLNNSFFIWMVYGSIALAYEDNFYVSSRIVVISPI